MADRRTERSDAVDGHEPHSLTLNGCNQVQDLAPLKGLPLTRLDLNSCTMHN